LIYTLVGKRGRGKTSLAAEIMANGKFQRIWIYDYMGEFMEFAHEGFIEVANSGFIEFMHRMWDESRAGIETLLVLDEIAVFGKDDPRIDHVFRLGRHKQIQIIATSQRFYSLPVICRSQTDIFSVFQITEKRDVDYLRGVVSDSVLQTIVGLQPFEYINVNL
jgi:hypothetical protein